MTVIINNTAIDNTLIDLGTTINMMTTAVLEALQLGQFLRPTPSKLELANRTTVNPAKVLDDIIVLVASWEYPVDFMVIESKDPSEGHPIILGIPWLATVGVNWADPGFTFNFAPTKDPQCWPFRQQPTNRIHFGIY